MIDTLSTVTQALAIRAKRQEVSDQLQNRAHQLLAVSDVRATVEKLAAEMSRTAMSLARSHRAETPK
jgi:hypothetical protein